MTITLDIDRSIPAFARHWLGCEVRALIDQIKHAVLVAELCPGDPLPAVMQLANDLDIGADVVTKAYETLKHESIIEIGYFGAFIHRNAVENCTAN